MNKVKLVVNTRTAQSEIFGPSKCATLCAYDANGNLIFAISALDIGHDMLKTTLSGTMFVSNSVFKGGCIASSIPTPDCVGILREVLMPIGKRQ